MDSVPAPSPEPQASRGSFTPGPWEAVQDKWTHTLDPDGSKVYIWRVVAPEGPYQSRPIIATTGVADAHLIAAAPDLYEALESAQPRIHSEFCSQMYDCDECIQAKAALAKARGES